MKRLLLLLPVLALAQDPATQPAADPVLDAEAKADAAKKALADKLDADFAKRVAECADTNRWFFAKGVLADREKGTVEVDAFTTGTQTNSICEFYLITLNSGHDYEAVFQTFAFASDVAKAFEFLGVPAGRPVAYPKMRFWSAGERVAATASVDGAPARPLGAFAARAGSGETLDGQAFVYVGGTRLADGSLDPVLCAGRADTAATLETIRRFHADFGYLMDPHTAVGVAAALAADDPADGAPVVCLSTAHPAKFPDAIGRATGDASLATEPRVEALKGAPTRKFPLPNDLRAVADFVAART